MPMTSSGFHRSKSVDGRSRQPPMMRATIRIVARLANCDGCTRMGPNCNQLLVPSAVPAPVPITSVAINVSTPIT
jgi:hypothetical protein